MGMTTRRGQGVEGGEHAVAARGVISTTIASPDSSFCGLKTACVPLREAEVLKLRADVLRLCACLGLDLVTAVDIGIGVERSPEVGWVRFRDCLRLGVLRRSGVAARWCARRAAVVAVCVDAGRRRFRSGCCTGPAPTPTPTPTPRRRGSVRRMLRLMKRVAVRGGFTQQAKGGISFLSRPAAENSAR